MVVNFLRIGNALLFTSLVALSILRDVRRGLAEEVGEILAAAGARGSESHVVIVLSPDELVAVCVRCQTDGFALHDFHRVAIGGVFGEASWWNALSAALFSMPNTFRRHPCTLILPEFSPLIKWLSMPKDVALHLLRATAAEALEMDMPMKERDFSWEFLPAGENLRDGYVFAERRAQLTPLFDLLATGNVFPDGAVFPAMADFAQGMCLASGDTRAQVCVGRHSISLLFWGGARPYMRRLPFGWNKLFDALPGEDGEEISKKNASASLHSWLKGREIEDEDLRVRMEGRIAAFLIQLSEEIEKTELQFVHRCRGKHIAKLYLCSEEIHSERLLQILSEKHKLQAVRMDLLPAMRMSRFLHRAISAVGDLTWMRILRTLANDLGKNATRSPLLPDLVIRRRIRSQCMRACVAALVFVWTLLGLGILYRNTQNHLLKNYLRETSSQRMLAKVRAQQVEGINAQRAVLQENFDRIDTVRRRQENYLRLFSELQTCLSAASDAWLEDFRMSNSREVVTKGEAPNVLVGGYLLIYNPEKYDSESQTLDRLNNLMQQLRNCESVADVIEINIPAREKYLQPFRCRLLLRHDEF
ncbi:MAG: hypothetical protein LBC42_00495 [Puniceicoccales bacterium]|jgi:hypothetical protein|nr:hypothetical protein [Puniceicoccales bacterium]